LIHIFCLFDIEFIVVHEAFVIKVLENQCENEECTP
jgi:hypothetical protein